MPLSHAERRELVKEALYIKHQIDGVIEALEGNQPAVKVLLALKPPHNAMNALADAIAEAAK